MSGGESPAVLRHRPARHSPSVRTMAQRDAAEKCPPEKAQGESQVSLGTAPHGWQRGRSHEQRQGEAGAPHKGPVAGSLLSWASRDRAGPWGQSCGDTSPAPQRCSRHSLSLPCARCVAGQRRIRTAAAGSPDSPGRSRPDAVRGDSEHKSRAAGQQSP